jgi:hypothetical protein
MPKDTAKALQPRAELGSGGAAPKQKALGKLLFFFAGRRVGRRKRRAESRGGGFVGARDAERGTGADLGARRAERAVASAGGRANREQRGGAEDRSDCGRGGGGLSRAKPLSAVC